MVSKMMTISGRAACIACSAPTAYRAAYSAFNNVIYSYSECSESGCTLGFEFSSNHINQ